MAKSTLSASWIATSSVTVNTKLPSTSLTVISLIDTLTTSSSNIVPTPVPSAILAIAVLLMLLRFTVMVSVGSPTWSSVTGTVMVRVVPLALPAGKVSVPLALV